MQVPRVRRMLVAVAALIGMLAGAAPVTAAPPAKIDLVVKGYTSAGSSEPLRAVLSADRTVDLRHRTMVMRFRLSGTVPGVHLLETLHPGACHRSNPEAYTDMTCGAQVASIGPGGTEVFIDGWVGASSTAKPGAVDTMTVTTTIPGYAPFVRTSSIRIGQQVEMKTQYDVPVVTAPPGGSFDARVPVRNNGSGEIRGVAISVRSQYAFESRVRYRNCWYADDQVTACLFDQILTPQTDYRLTLPYRLRGDTSAPSDNYTGLTWMTRAEFDDLYSFLRRAKLTTLGTPGTGGVLRLDRVAAARSADLPQADPWDNNSAAIKVVATGVRSADLAAIGDRASGRAGAVVTVSVGLHNDGPATVDRQPSEEETPAVVVWVPRGTTALAVPAVCYPFGDDGRVDHSRPGAIGQRRYFCRFGSMIRAGTDTTVDVRLRIDKVYPNTRGTVQVAHYPPDLDTRNNKAYITLNAPARPGPSTSPHPSTSPGTSPGTSPTATATATAAVTTEAVTAGVAAWRSPGRRARRWAGSGRC